MPQFTLKKLIQRLLSQSPDERMKLVLCFLLVLFGFVFLYRWEEKNEGNALEDDRFDQLSPQPFSELETYYETKLKEALASTNNLKTSHVLINFNSTAETTYLTDEQFDLNEQRQLSGDEAVDEHVSNKTTTSIVMEEIDRNRQPVAAQTNKPAVEGVLIVIEGQEAMQIKKQCIDLVSKYLAVSPHRVAVQFKGG